MVIKGYEDNLGAPLRAVREDVEREWGARLAAEEAKRQEADAWAAELARALDKEKKVCTSRPPIQPHHTTVGSGLTNCYFFFFLLREYEYIGTPADGGGTPRARGVCDQV